MKHEPTETLWAVYTNTDLTEGRGREYVKHFCRIPATANRLAKRGYVQGADCPVKPVQVLLLDGKHVLPTSFIHIEEPSREDNRAQDVLTAKQRVIAKAKAAGLTESEIALLGGA